MTNLPINLKDPKKLMAVAVVILLGGLFLYVRFLLLPQIQWVTKSYDKAGKILTEVRVSERDAAQVDALKKQVSKYSEKIDSYEKMLPAEQEIPKLLESLSNMAKGANVKILGITPMVSKQEPGPTEIYQEQPILINGRAGYHELGKFISDLENSDRFMKVVDISIRENKSSPKKHDVELLVMTYKLLRNK
jgi:type IV pilus assembly protein PilO